MWFVRQCSMLALMAALLLPPGLYRDCCCARRQAKEQAANASKLRPCCKARMLAQQATRPVSTPSNRIANASRGQRLMAPLCQCRGKLASDVAVLNVKTRADVGTSEFLNDSLMPAFNFGRMDVLSQVEPTNRYKPPSVGLPLRTTLCRWII